MSAEQSSLFSPIRDEAGQATSPPQSEVTLNGTAHGVSAHHGTCGRLVSPRGWSSGENGSETLELGSDVFLDIRDSHERFQCLSLLCNLVFLDIRDSHERFQCFS